MQNPLTFILYERSQLIFPTDLYSSGLVTDDLYDIMGGLLDSDDVFGVEISWIR